MTCPVVSPIVCAMQHRPLDVPPSLSGVDDIVRSIEWAVIDLWNRASPDLHPQLRTIQLGVPQLVRIFTERLRVSPASVQEVRFWRRVHGSPDGHMIWVGMGKPDPQCDWTTNGETRRSTPARVAWLLLRGQDIPPDKHLRKTCDRDRCIAPDCHVLSSDYGSRPSLKRIRKDVLSDGQGGYIHARCGTPLRSAPRPGRRVYCAVCYQDDVRLLKAAEAARMAQYRVQNDNSPRQHPEPVSLVQPTLAPADSGPYLNPEPEDSDDAEDPQPVSGPLRALVQAPAIPTRAEWLSCTHEPGKGHPDCWCVMFDQPPPQS